MKRFFGKKQVMLATLAVALGLAVYLNYYFAQQDTLPQIGGHPSSDTATTTTAGKHMGDSQFVNAPTTANPTTGTTTVDTNESEYFRKARENRENEIGRASCRERV